jgi:hypothetical protein
MMTTVTDCEVWGARTNEDKMLELYQQARRGQTFVEVPLGGPGGRGRWPAGCARRRLDGVRFGGITTGIIQRYRPDSFDRSLTRSSGGIELIEVKPVLSLGAVGQAVAGQVMFAREYGVEPSETAIVCTTADPGSEFVCERLGIKIGRVNFSARSRRNKALTGEEGSMLQYYMLHHDGTIRERLAVRSPYIGRNQWPPGAVNHVIDAVRFLPRGDSGGEVEVIELAPKLIRGSIGRVLGGALLLEGNLGLRVARRVILFRQGDSALEWVCDKLGILTEKV